MFAVAVAFFSINFFFQYQNQDTIKRWNEQQAAKKLQKIKQLEGEIAQRTVKPSTLPLVELYADEKGTEFITVGVKNDQTVLTLSWKEQPPHRIFSRKLGSNEVPEEYYLMFAPSHVGGPLMYHQGIPGKMAVGDLPEFGKYDLQLISLFPNDKVKPFAVTVADYIDGHFSIPLERLQNLKNENGLFETISEKLVGNGIVLRKVASGYLPVATYNAETHTANYFVDMENMATLISQPELKETPTSNQMLEEKFFVLENDFQQLVFSNVGGALAEINLPFKTRDGNETVVKEIEFDRQMVAQHPYNAKFPSRPYYTPGKNAQGPFEDHIQGKLGGYYPLIRRDLIESRNRKSIKIEPRYYALNIVSEYPEVANLIYEVKEFTKDKIVFETVQHHRRIKKTFSIAIEEEGAPYCVNLAIEIEGDSRGLWLTSGVPEVEWISGSPAPALKYRITRNQKADVVNIDLPKDAITISSIYPDWVCTSNGFFGSIMNPISEIDAGLRAQYVSGTVVPSRLVEIDQEFQKFKAQDLPGYLMMLPLNSKGGAMNFHVFAGPFADEVLAAVDKFYSDPATGYNPEFMACQSFHGWFAFISEPFADFLFILMKFFYRLTGSWAFSIILLTIALRLMLYPLNAWSMKSMVKMQQIAPEVTAIQEKYKKDPKKAQVEIMNLYRSRGVNPMSGCLPLLIQMPFLIGMFDLLKSTFELRGASFIPGWIDNLTAPDVLFSWTTPIFFIGNQFHLLPVLLGAVMFFQQRMMSTLPKDPKLWTEQQRQQRAMGSVMTIVFTVMFYHFPSGLNIYWLSSMLLGILQQWWTQKHLKVVQPKPTK